MIVVIIGGGRTGAQLARVLLSQDHEVHLIESRPNVLARIHKELPTEVIHEGDPMDPKVLESAKIQDANVFCATSTEDEENLDHQFDVYDALYAWCRLETAKNKS